MLLVEFLDELYSGTIGLGASGVQAQFSASYTEVASALLLVPALVALCIEPLIFVLADRYPRSWFLCGGTALMGCGGLAACVAPSLPWLSVAISVAYLGSGAGVALAQATLVDRHPAETERKLALWTLLGELGDLSAPLLVAAIALLGGDWRWGLGVVSLAMLGWAVSWAVSEGASGWRIETPEEGESRSDEDEEPGIVETLGIAVRRRELVGWLAAAATCELMDDLLTVFAVLYLKTSLHVSNTTISLVIGAGSLGSVCGLFAAERVFLRRAAPLRVLWSSSAACVLSFVLWLVVTEPLGLCLSFFAIGVSAAPLYPITISRAYAALPDQSGAVNAVAHLFTPLTLLAPLGMGLLADHWGLRVAMSLALLQPLCLLIVGLVGKDSPAKSKSP